MEEVNFDGATYVTHALSFILRADPHARADDSPAPLRHRTTQADEAEIQ